MDPGLDGSDGFDGSLRAELDRLAHHRLTVVPRVRVFVGLTTSANDAIGYKVGLGSQASSAPIVKIRQIRLIRPIRDPYGFPLFTPSPGTD